MDAYSLAFLPLRATIDVSARKTAYPKQFVQGCDVILRIYIWDEFEELLQEYVHYSKARNSKKMRI
jgi:hypothetical protein